MQGARSTGVSGPLVPLGGALVVVAARQVARQRARRRERLAVRPSDHGVTSVDVALTSAAGTPLHAWWVAGRPGAPTVLLVHGHASHAGDLAGVAPALVAAGMSVLLLDCRGHGRSPWRGRATPTTFGEDVEVALDWLLAHPDVGPVALLGHSMGGSTVIRVAAGRPDVRAVVAVAAVADPTLTAIGGWPAALNRLLLERAARRMDVDPSVNFARNVIRELDVPVMVVHGERDRVVPPVHARTLAAAQPRAELVLLPDADHADLDGFAEAFPPVVHFLREALVGASS